MVLQVSSTLSLPADGVTQTFACIGCKGAGKTYLASLLAEQMLDIAAQVVILDPVGNWYGLRVAANGKDKGKDIFIAGGEHGDVPILPELGARFARLVVEKNVSMVLDVSGFRQGARKRFAADFAEEFFHLKKTQRSAVHLFVEEAQMFIPQRSGPDEARMLGAYENIIRLGRNYGIGATLISQRPQSVNKEVLSQVECLCVLQLNGSHERKALEEWVQEAGADRKLVGQLPGLGRGEGFVWSPAWLRIFDRVHFSKKTTFDASATLEVGKATKTAKLSAIDVATLKADLQAVIASAEKDDPKVLRQRIRELEAEIDNKLTASAPAAQMIADPAVVERIVAGEIQRFFEAARENIGNRLAGELENMLARIRTEGNSLVSVLRDEASWKLGGFSAHGKEMMRSVPSIPKQTLEAAVKLKPDSEWPKQSLAPVRTTQSSGSLSGPEQRILNAIAWLEFIGVESPEQPAVAFLAGYTYGGGGYNNPRGRLNVAGLVEYVAAERIRLTDSGKRAAVYPDQIGGNEELHEAVLQRLPGPEKRLLGPLIAAWPPAMHNETLASEAGYKAGAGGFNNPRGRLRALGLIDYPSPGMVRAKDLLFPMKH